MEKQVKDFALSHNLIIYCLKESVCQINVRENHPILDDFLELEPDKNDYKNFIENDLLDRYVQEHMTEKGIELKRVLYGIVARK